MDLVVFENDKPYVINEAREGRFDYLELASDVAETKFFQFLFGQGIVDQLADHYPSPRHRECVPLGMYVSSQLSLRLHGSHRFHSYPLIVRSGGLLDALGPEIAQRQVDLANGRVTIHCQGFNHRNRKPRATPCDLDYLRKLAKQTEPQALEAWYNRQVAALYGQLNAYDPEGLFVGDGSYLFVPDNEHYEGSQRLLFDAHNHPVSKEEEQKMTPAQRKRCRWRRCYRVVFLLHIDRAGERFVVAGLRVMRANQAEAPALWDLLETFVDAVGRGVLKVLLVDRGFIDGSQIGRLKTEFGVDTVIPIRKNMDILQDVRGIVTLDVPWEEYRPARREPRQPPRTKDPVIAKREKKRQKTLAKKRAAAERESARPQQSLRADADHQGPAAHELVGVSGAVDRRVLQGLLRRRSRGRLAAGDHESRLGRGRGAGLLRPADGHRGAASAGEVFLGPDTIPLHGLESDRESGGVCGADL